MRIIYDIQIWVLYKIIEQAGLTLEEFTELL